jgi:hypothetical protein
MTNPIIKIVNAESGEEIEREMNAEELAQLEADLLSVKAEEEAKLKAIETKKVLLQKLGITEEEAKLLLS